MKESRFCEGRNTKNLFEVWQIGFQISPRFDGGFRKCQIADYVKKTGIIADDAIAAIIQAEKFLTAAKKYLENNT